METDNSALQESMYEKWDNLADDEYPVDLDDIEWESFTDHIEMTAACDMPDEMVKQLSTEQLLEKALHYPLLCDLFAYDTIEQGLDALKLQSNIIRELSERTDLAELVLAKYEETTITDATGNCESDFQSVSETILLEGFLEGLYAEK